MNDWAAKRLRCEAPNLTNAGLDVFKSRIGLRGGEAGRHAGRQVVSVERDQDNSGPEFVQRRARVGQCLKILTKPGLAGGYVKPAAQPADSNCTVQVGKRTGAQKRKTHRL